MVTDVLYKNNKIYAYFSNIRVFEWRAFLGMAIFGYLIGTKIHILQNNLILFSKFLITTAFYLAFSFAINNCYDIEGDKLGEMISKNPVASGILSKKEGLLQSLILAFFGIICTYYWFDLISTTIYCFMTLLSWSYSAPPFRMKSIPFIDVFSHGLFFGSLLVLFGLNISGNIDINSIYLVFSIFIFSLILQLRNHLEDAKEDSAAGIQTTVTKIGINNSKKFIKILYFIHVLIIISFLYSVNEWWLLFLSLGIIISMLLFRRIKLDFFNILKIGDVFTTVAYIIFVFSVLLN